jgi:uncharacterized protein
MVTRAIGRVTIIGRGHAAITASHAKTVELVTEPEVGARATCVVAVGAQLEGGDIADLRGWIDLTIEAGGVSDVVRGHANPAFAAGDRLVVRRAPAPVRDALLVEADKGASELNPRLVAALKDAGATVTVTLSPAPDERPGRGALIVSPGAPWSSQGAATRPADLTLRSPLSPEDVELATRSLEDAAYISLDANLARDPAAISLIQAAWSGGHFVLPAGDLGALPSALAVAGVDLSNVNVVDLRALARRPGSIELEATCVAVAVPSADVARAIGAILKAIPSARGVVVLDPGTGRMHTTPWWAPTMSAVASQRGREAIVVAGRGASASDPDSTEVLPGPVAVLAAELVARGASTRDVSAALQRATGMSRKAAYAAALELVPPDS